jgi:predicted TIM-barrel fold metal-dependent hydrolase
MEELRELTAALDPDARRQLLGENVARLYRLA